MGEVDELDYKLEVPKQELELLLRAYVDLNMLHAEPGEKSHRLWESIGFIQRMIREMLK